MSSTLKAVPRGGQSALMSVLMVLSILLTLAMVAGCDAGGDGAEDGGSTAVVDTGTLVGDDVVEPDDGADPPGEDIQTTPPEDVPVVPDIPIVEDIPIVPETPPEPPAYSAGQCPTFTAGTNTFTSDGRTRKFELYLPDQPVGAPMLFIWHGVGDSPANIASFFGATSFRAGRGGIVVAPYDCCGSGNTECCNQLFVWSYAPTASTAPDLTLFDDLMSCLKQQFDYDAERVYSTSFSAGSLWTTHLLMHRAEYFAAVAIFSGGCGQGVQEYNTPSRKVPAILAWGGTADTYAAGIVKFYELMANLIGALSDDGHFIVTCDHGSGHTVPWGVTPWVHEFLLSHTWSTKTSPYATTGLTDAWPDYCEIP